MGWGTSCPPRSAWSLNAKKQGGRPRLATAAPRPERPGPARRPCLPLSAAHARALGYSVCPVHASTPSSVPACPSPGPWTAGPLSHPFRPGAEGRGAGVVTLSPSPTLRSVAPPWPPLSQTEGGEHPVGVRGDPGLGAAPSGELGPAEHQPALPPPGDRSARCSHVGAGGGTPGGRTHGRAVPAPLPSHPCAPGRRTAPGPGCAPGAVTLGR